MELFAYPIFFLYFALVLIGLIPVIWLGNTLKNRVIHALFGPVAYKKLTAGIQISNTFKNALFLTSLFFLFAALARPQWGSEIIEAQGSFAQTVIAVDLSDSMRARDLEPDRLNNAKNMLTLLISNLRNERIGIIAFTSQAYVQSPITTDEAALKHFVSSLRPGMLPVPGTSIAEPVKLAARMLAKYPGQKALILLTDGEDHSPEELKQAKQIAATNGIRVIAVGIGTKDGALIPDKVDNSGKVLEYKKDKEGKTVISKLDEKSLAELAEATGGLYIQYTTPSQVALKIENNIKDLDRSASRVAARAGYKNRYRLPLSLAFICLAVWMLFPQRKLNFHREEGSKKVK